MNTKQRYIDIAGQTFGRLTVLNFSHISKYRTAIWNCLCDCGTVKAIAALSLKNGATKSCGCIKHELDINRLKKHGQTANGKVSRTYKTWNGLRTRCYNKNNKGFKNYGARGITVCDRWLNSFENFLEDMGERPYGKTLDRYPDKNGIYELKNCRWATPKEQGENTRKCRIFEHNGMSMNISDWAKYFKVHRTTLLKHLKKGKEIQYLFSFYNNKLP